MPKKEKNKKEPPSILPISDIAVLGLVNTRMYMGFESGITGKQLLDEMQKANFPDWVEIKYSTLYNCLSRLEKYNYLKSIDDVDIETRKRIKLYKITISGKEALKNDLIHLLNTHIRERCPLDLAIANIGLLPRKSSLEALKKYQMQLEKGIEYLGAYVNGLKHGKSGDIVGHILLNDSMMPVLHNLLALFERPYLELVTRSKWLVEFIQKLEVGKIFTI